MAAIHNKVVYGGPALCIPAHLNFGQHILDTFKTICEEEADRVAIINGETGENTTYIKLLQDLVDFGTGLKKLGVKRGDIVALCSENRTEYLVAGIAAITCGACITPLSTHYTKDEMIHALNISKPNILISSEVVNQASYSTFKSLPFIKTVIQLNGVPKQSNVLSYKDIAIPTSIQDYEVADVQGWTDVCYLLYSSGTTGLPKGVMLTHVNVLYSVSNFSVEDGSYPDLILLTIVPWYHAYGLMSTVNYLACKKKLVYLTGFNPHTYLNAIQEYKVNVLLAVPPIVVYLGKSPLTSKYDLSSVLIVFCGAAPLTSETISDALKSLPSCLGVFQAYGMTETSLAATTDKDFEKSKSGSAGYPINGVKAKVVDIETRQKLDCYESGEVCLKGPVTMKGYAGNDAATRDIFDEEGYLKTGDIGYYDKDGCFFVIDRLKELIKYKSNQVPPAEVESVLLECPGVAECAVVGAPDEAAGELPTAFVVPKQNARLTHKEVIEFAASRLSYHKRLHGGVIFVDSIPKNPSGKILRRVLRQQLAQKQKSKI
ncbi:hypothetical protein evm_005281 [Chilo suppressalis]|nr:hypothetical protein evm_005281 [Chilo suppressalis]